MLAGCGHTQEVAASEDELIETARDIVGTSLVGTKGKTPEDQLNIELTVSGLCSTGVWQKSECLEHELSQAAR